MHRPYAALIASAVMLISTMGMMAEARVGSFKSGGFHVSHSYTPHVSRPHVSTPKVTVPKTTVRTSTVKPKAKAVVHVNPTKPTRPTGTTPEAPEIKPTQTAGSTIIPVPLPIVVNGHEVKDTKVLYETYGIDPMLAHYYLDSKDCPQSDRDLWNKTLTQHFEKGKAPEKSEEVKQFEERLVAIRPAFQAYQQKQHEIQAKRAKEAQETLTSVIRWGLAGFTAIVSLCIIGRFIFKHE